MYKIKTPPLGESGSQRVSGQMQNLRIHQGDAKSLQNQTHPNYPPNDYPHYSGQA